MGLSGTTLPQITSSGGNISGTYHIVTTDGAGPIQAVLDPTATGDFASAAAVPLTVIQQIPGVKGNFVAENKDQKQKQKQKQQNRSLWQRAAASLSAVGKMMMNKRGAANVNKSFEFAFAVPQGTTCSGTVAGMTGVCPIKIANSNKAGPFGGVVPVQMVSAAATDGTGTGAAAVCGRAFKG